MSIDSSRLRELRISHDLKQKVLAYRAGISIRQLARLEGSSEAAARARPATVARLAEALKVSREVLAGRAPLPEVKTSEAAPLQPQRVNVSAALLPDVRLAYALLRRRYGVKPGTLFNAAPLLFVLVAEGSLQWRRERVAAIEDAYANLLDCTRDAPHLKFTYGSSDVERGAYEERASIESADLFGESVATASFELGYDLHTNNPFADYLRMLAEELDVPGIIEMDADSDLSPDGFPDAQLLSEDLDVISDGSDRAKHALRTGLTTLRELPAELWGEEAASKRARWLEDKVSDDEWADWQSLFVSLLPDSNEAARQETKS